MRISIDMEPSVVGGALGANMNQSRLKPLLQEGWLWTGILNFNRTGYVTGLPLVEEFFMEVCGFSSSIYSSIIFFLTRSIWSSRLYNWSA